MILREAQKIVQQVLAPEQLDNFLDNILGQRFIKVGGDGSSYRAGILGANPEQAILEAFDKLAPNITCHAAAPLGPHPIIQPVASESAFKAKIDAFHALRYTVRVPLAGLVSPRLDEFLRALEFLLHKPATAAAFWSRGDARAPVHHDDYDIIVLQLIGRKKWFISTNRSELPNLWENIPTGPIALGPHEGVDVGPGDCLYLPRGTRHRVDSLADSIHLSIGFVPLTLREAVVAALDHFSDLDRTLRETVGGRVAHSVAHNGFSDLAPKIRECVAQLQALCKSDDFIAQAMQRRSSREIADLKKLEASARRTPISANSLVRHGRLAMSHLSTSQEKIDFGYPGGHIYIHKGAEECVRFIAATPMFRIRDVPGAVGDEIRFALIEKFLSTGFLEQVLE